MNILWFTWKDMSHPEAGGAEVVASEIAKRLVKDGNKVKFVTGGYPGAAAKEKHPDGYTITRLGNRYTVYFKAYQHYKNKLQGWPDLIVEEINTIPFFTKFYAKERKVLMIHQLARQIWFYQMFFPLNAIGYLAEWVYLWLLNNQNVITVSNSTKNDLINNGFKPRRISIISEGITIKPVKDVKTIKKFPAPTMLSLGAMRPMKRTLDQIKAFENAKQYVPDLTLKVAGDSSGKYGDTVLRYIESSPHKKDIEVLGRVSDKQKRTLMQKCHVIAVTSVKEGWGLIVTEAASQGTPAVAYDVDGLRDSIQNGKTGYISATNPQALAVTIKELLRNKKTYAKIQNQALKNSLVITFNACYHDFKKATNIP